MDHALYKYLIYYIILLLGKQLMCSLSTTYTANSHEYLNINVDTRTVTSHEHVGALENFYTRNARTRYHDVIPL